MDNTFGAKHKYHPCDLQQTFEAVTSTSLDSVTVLLFSSTDCNVFAASLNMSSYRRNTGPKTGLSDLSTTDINLLTRIFSHAPPPSTPSTSYQVLTYRRITRDDIANLPTSLRSSSAKPVSCTLTRLFEPERSSRHHQKARLCSLHAGLNPRLIHSIHHMIKRELSSKIPALFAALAAHGSLSLHEAMLAAALDDARAIWLRRGSYEDRTAQDGTAKARFWTPQPDGCKACVLARLGGQREVALAGLTGMVARGRRVGKKGRTGKRVHSRRLRWFEGWVKVVSEGNEVIEECWEAGERLAVELNNSGARFEEDSDEEEEEREMKVSKSTQTSDCRTKDKSVSRAGNSVEEFRIGQKSHARVDSGSYTLNPLPQTTPAPRRPHRPSDRPVPDPIRITRFPTHEPFSINPGADGIITIAYSPTPDPATTSSIDSGDPLSSNPPHPPPTRALPTPPLPPPAPPLAAKSLPVPPPPKSDGAVSPTLLASSPGGWGAWKSDLSSWDRDLIGECMRTRAGPSPSVYTPAWGLPKSAAESVPGRSPFVGKGVTAAGYRGLLG